MSLLPFIQKLGVGPRGSKDLTREEAREATRALLSEGCDPVGFGAFCMALRMKGESDEELIGGLEGLFDLCPDASEIDWKTERLVTLSSSLDGRNKSALRTPAATLLAVERGARVLVISDRDVPPKKGVTAALVFEAMGYAPATDFEVAAQEVGSRGWSCLELSKAIPGLDRVKPWRAELGKRPYLSVLEKALNPARSPFLTGAFHGPILGQMACLAREAGYPKTMVVQGAEGSSDLKASAPTRACLAEAGRETETLSIDPASYDLACPEEPLLDSLTPEGCAAWTERALSGEDDSARRTATLQAGLLLHLAGVSDSLREGMEATKARVP